ncbi:EamA family transporter|uniref:Transporter family protein n=1 Tax=Dendrosporobacter quercicolus TaxID=146817 RepID=A0A1G9YBU2_9FIRM|nr:EamA family transporter [Dendrosporobacter quercicolus]NSL47601.1 EamA family transporter [Dendrosporobacter quercicolus DSM 1736]SDN06507.1 transporter family protein [Dendrosporobacter quercicolus]
MEHLWLIFSLLSAFSASLVGIFGKLGLTSADPNAATAVRAIIMAVFLFGVVIVQGNLQEIPAIIADKKVLLYIGLSGLAGALSWLFYFWALKFGKVSQVAPIDKLSVVIAAVLAVIFLGEKINLLNAVGIGLIAIGALIVSIS